MKTGKTLDLLVAAIFTIESFLLGSGCATLPKQKKDFHRKPDVTGEPSVSKIYREALNFPDELKGARKVDKYLIPNAKYYLVHIRWDHLFENATQKELEQIKRVNLDVISILIDLKDKINLSENRTERIAWDPDNRAWIFNRAEPQYNGDMALYPDIWSKPAQLYSEWKKACIMVDKYNSSNFFRKLLLYQQYITIVFETREDTLLELISNENKPGLYTTLYGGDHAWGGKDSCGPDYPLSNRVSLKDNIKEWNLQHPDKVFGLIEIIPSSYIE